MREQVVCETDIALPALKELACQFVDRKVSSDFQAFGNDFSWTSFLVLAIVLTVCGHAQAFPTHSDDTFYGKKFYQLNYIVQKYFIFHKISYYKPRI